MVGLIGARCLRVKTVRGSTSYIKDLIKMKIASKSMHAFSTRALKLSNEVCVLRYAHTNVHCAKYYPYNLYRC